MSSSRSSAPNTLGQADSFTSPGTVVVPTRNDVIFGRGSAQTGNPGNARLYDVIDSFLPEYEACPTRSEKSVIIQAIYNRFRLSGRFVQVEQATGRCFVASHSTAKTKISHAVRYRIKARDEAQARLEEQVPDSPPHDEDASVDVDRPDSPDESLFSDEQLESVLLPGQFDDSSEMPEIESLEDT